MQRVFRVVNIADLTPAGMKTTARFNRSVRRYGVVIPILVAEMPDQDGVTELKIIDGNRRVRAVRAERLPKVPAVVLKATSATDRARLTLICNHMRSLNFHTESAAILALAEDNQAAEQAARVMGLGPGRMLQLFHRITTMPDAVRQAMYEHRIPVSAATWVGNWPEELQQEVVELLGRRRYVNTTTLQGMKMAFEQRYPEAFHHDRSGRERASIEQWVDESNVVDVPIPGPIVGGIAARGNQRAERIPESMAATPPAVPVQPLADDPAEEPVSHVEEPMRVLERPVPASSSSPPASREMPCLASPPMRQVPPVDPSSVVVRNSPQTTPSEVVQGAPRPPGDPFLSRLDGELLTLAQENRSRDLSRAVWVDRAMRAWNLAEAASGAQMSASVGD